MPDEKDRRRYQRVRAPVLWRPMGKPLFGGKTQPIDISKGGLRVYADDPLSPGDRLEIELFLPDDTSVICEVQIVWIDALPAGAPAKFDMGLKFLHEAEAHDPRLVSVLDDAPAE